MEDLTWRTSSRSSGNGGNCVEVAARAGAVHVRDSKDRHGPVLTFTAADWHDFLTSTRTGRLHRS